MRSINKTLIIGTLMGFALLISGCKTTLVIHNATVENITPIFHDYIGTHGYQLTYENPETGSYRVSLGEVYRPERSETTKSSTIVVQPPAKDTNMPLTSYEDTSWRTVSTPGHYVEATAIVLIFQQDNNVIINVDSNDVGGASIDDLKGYIEGLGYAVNSR